MRILRLEAWAVELPLSEPYTIAYETVDRVTNLFVRLVTDGTLAGFGCAAPAPEVTGEQPEDVLAALVDVAGPLVAGSDPLRYGRTLERLRAPLVAFPAALAAVDMALHDLLGKIAGLPLWQLLGGYRRQIVTSVTIGILPEDETLRHARRRVAEGFRALKLKGGLDDRDDAEKVLAVRAAVGPEIELRFDANQGYTAEQALRFVDAVRPANLKLIEQPTPRRDHDELARVTAGSDLPVMADESLMNLDDAIRLVGRRRVHLLNVKLMKVGGIAETLRISAVARSAGLEVMVGCMDEAALAIAAGLAAALARPNLRYADLDGHLDLADDPTRGAVILEDGRLAATGRPGLGFDLD
ncbi:MAG: dipeptide epimerase [Acidobacteria bacterium]|nr:dipeptide epimerase [Acidobacteriota bacterium]